MKINKKEFIGICAVMIVMAFFGCDNGNNNGNNNSNNEHTHIWAWAESTVWGMESEACSVCKKDKPNSGLRLCASVPLCEIFGSEVIDKPPPRHAENQP